MHEGNRGASAPGLVLMLLASLACSNGGPVSSGSNEILLDGFWDVAFSGTIVERFDGGGAGESQTDSLTLELRSSGSRVTGQLVFSGLEELPIPLTGIVSGSRFDYRAEIAHGTCLGFVEAETTLDASGTRFTGRQTQSNCEGMAVGTVTAWKR